MNIFAILIVGCVLAVFAARLVNENFLENLETQKAKIATGAGVVLVIICGMLFLHGVNKLLWLVNDPGLIGDGDIERLVSMRNMGAYGVPIGMFLISLGLHHIRKK